MQVGGDKVLPESGSRLHGELRFSLFVRETEERRAQEGQIRCEFVGCSEGGFKTGQENDGDIHVGGGG